MIFPSKEEFQPQLQKNHRPPVGREKRERARALLMNLIMAVCSGRKLTGSTVVENVVRHANVSRGTLYKYFDLLDEAVIRLAFKLVKDMTIGIVSVYNIIADPALRIAVGFQTFLMRALMDPGWGAFIIHADHTTARAYALLCEEAPDKLNWWNPIVG